MEQKYIDKQQNLVDICQSIDEVLLQHKNWSYKLINRLFWCRFSKNIHTLPSVKQIIHGDFGMKNILLDAANSPHIIDFEMLRYGYITEDWAMLLLQLAGFSRLWGSMNKFEIYYEQVKSLADKKTWLYGVQMYYAKRLLRRLQNSHKKYGWRKNISFLCSLLRYFTVAKFIRQV